MISFSRSARLAPVLLAAAAMSAPELAAARLAAASGSISFVCESGTRFSAAYFRDHAWITTAQGSWRLAHRPSASLERRYQSERATFVDDNGLAALNGLPGGPFRGCRREGLLLTGARR